MTSQTSLFDDPTVSMEPIAPVSAQEPVGATMAPAPAQDPSPLPVAAQKAQEGAEMRSPMLLLRVSSGSWGIERTVDRSALSEKAQQAGKLAAAAKHLIDPATASYRAILDLDQERTAYLQVPRILPLDIGLRGVVGVPLALVSEVDTWLCMWAERRAEAARTFAQEGYVEAARLARTRLEPAGLFDPRQYPNRATVQSRFWARHQWLAVNTPDALATADPRIYARQIAQEQERIATVAEQCRIALRSTFADITQRLAEALTPDADGKRKRIFTSTVEKVQEFASLFGRADVTGDAELAALVNRMAQVAQGMTPDALKTDDQYRDRIRSAAAEISTKAASMVELAPSRVITLDEE